MSLSELMHTPTVTCTPKTTLGDAARTMRDRGVGSLVVVDQLGYVAGIVTDRDLAVRGMGEGRSADVAVELVMSRNVVSVPPQADVDDLVSLMAEHCIRRLPVVDDEGRPHSVITFDDVLRHVASQADALADMVLLQSTMLARH